MRSILRVSDTAREQRTVPGARAYCSGQEQRSSPQPGPHGYMHSETGGAKASVGRHKTVHWRHGDRPRPIRLSARRRDAANFRSLRYGRCFHVHCGRSVSLYAASLSVPALLPHRSSPASHGRNLYRPGAVARVDHGARLEYFTDTKSRVQGADKTTDNI